MVEKNITLTGFHPLRFFSKLGKREKNAAFFTSGEWQIISWNPVRTIAGKDASVFERLKKLPKNTSKLPFSGGAIGYCSYDFGCALLGIRSRHRALPEAIFHEYNQAILWNGKRLVARGDESFIEHVRAIHARPFVNATLPSIEWRSSLTKSDYRKKFTAVMRGIRDGDFYQLNLSYPFIASSNSDRRRLFAALTEAHPAPCASYFEHNDTEILSLSPERFVTIKNGVITTCPIKGTRPRGKTPAEDKRLAEGLLGSPKEAAELNMITDLLRNDVGKVSVTGSVKVLEHRSLQKNPSVWHTYSVIQGTLEKNLHPVDAFASMFPGGSVTGCPKIAAMHKIDQLEDQARGAYCGSMLMLSASGFLDSTVLIRTIESYKKALKLGMGGGIVADSDCAAEYHETVKKAQPFLDFSSLQSPRYYRGQHEIPADTVSSLFDLANKKTIGVFETMRAENGKIHDLSAHLTRLRHSANLFDINIPSESVLQKNLRFAVKNNVLRTILRIKIICTNNDTVIQTRPLVVDPARLAGISVMIVPLDRALPEAKSLPYHREFSAHQKALNKGCGEALLMRSDGSVCEGAYSNLFFVKDGVLWTADSDILFGITRQTVIRHAKCLKIPVRFVSLQKQDITQAEEIFITSTLTGVIPVVRVGNDIVGKGKVGKITKRLQEGFDAHYATLRI